MLCLPQVVANAIIAVDRPGRRLLSSAPMSAQSHWTFGASTLHRVVEYEAPILSPFELFGDCTQAHLDQNRPWLIPRFQDAASGILIITIQSFLIRRDGLTVLVDACGGTTSKNPIARLSRNVPDASAKPLSARSSAARRWTMPHNRSSGAPDHGSSEIRICLLLRGTNRKCHEDQSGPQTESWSAMAPALLGGPGK